METRTRSRGTAPAAPSTAPSDLVRGEGRAARAGRSGRAGRAGTVPSTEDQASNRPPSNDIPRRGARLPEKAHSIAPSLATVPQRADGESESENEESSEDEVEETDGDERREIVHLTIPDLEIATEDLLRVIQKPTLTGKTLQIRRNIKRNAFANVRSCFESSDSAPFADWVEVLDHYENEDERMAAAGVIARANIVTALDEVLNIQSGDVTDPAAFLERLDSSFPELFVTSNHTFEDPELTLDLRTWHLIESLTDVKNKTDLYALVASTFCEPAEGIEDAKRFSGGPFRPLGNPVTEDTETLCSNRISEIILAFKKAKTQNGAVELKKKFPFEETLEVFKTWLLEMLDFLKYADGQVTTRVTGGLGSELGTPSESQPIVRVDKGKDGPSLFVGKTSLAYLQKQAGRPAASARNLAGLASSAPQDYLQHSNELLLGVSPRAPPPSRRPKNAPQAGPHPEDASDAFEPDEEEGEGEFEQDTRIVSKGKRSALAESRPAKKARTAPHSGQQQTQQQSQQQTQQSPSSSAQSRPPPSSQPDFAALKMAKSQVTRQARLLLEPTARQRHAWTDHDCAVLLDLVRDHQAAWAAMEPHKDRFNHPRNQQAYRDKARNMKVDYLMTDAVLPPCFDLVALGKKETERLTSLGKNPYRRENDVDENGNAVNTEIA